MGFLENPGQNAARRHVIEFPFIGKLVCLPDFRQHGHGLVPPVARLPGVNSQAGLLVGVGTAGAEFNTAIGQLVHHRDPLCDPHGMVVGENRDAESDADVLGPLAQGAKQHLGTGRTRETHEEMVLYKPEVVEPDLVGQFALVQGLLIEAVPVHVVALVGTLPLI